MHAMHTRGTLRSGRLLLTEAAGAERASPLTALPSGAGVLTAGHGHARPGGATVWAPVPPAPPLPQALRDTEEARAGLSARRHAHARGPGRPSTRPRRAPLDEAHERAKVARCGHPLTPYRRLALRDEQRSQTLLACMPLVAAWMIIK